jgi:hypothetical protein
MPIAARPAPQMPIALLKIQVSQIWIAVEILDFMIGPCLKK